MAKSTYQVSITDEATQELRKIRQGFEDLKGSVKTLRDIESLEFFTKAFGQIKAVISGSLKEFGDAEQSAIKLELALRNSAVAGSLNVETIQELGKSLQTTANVSDDLVAETAAMLTSFRTLSSDGIQDVLKSSADLSAFLGQDFKSTAQALGKALEDPTAAAKNLRAMNIVLTESEKELIEKWVDKGNAAKAQAVILDAVNQRSAGAASQTANSFNGSLTAVENSLGDLQELIGEGLAPTIRLFAGLLNGAVQLLNQVPAPVLGAVTAFAALRVGLPLAGAALQSVAGLTASLGPNFAKAGTAAAGFGTKIAGMAGPIGIAIAAISALISAMSEQIALGAEWDAILKGTSDKAIDEQIKSLRAREEELKKLSGSAGTAMVAGPDTYRQINAELERTTRKINELVQLQGWQLQTSNSTARALAEEARAAAKKAEADAAALKAIGTQNTENEVALRGYAKILDEIVSREVERVRIAEDIARAFYAGNTEQALEVALSAGFVKPGDEKLLRELLGNRDQTITLDIQASSAAKRLIEALKDKKLELPVGVPLATNPNLIDAEEWGPVGPQNDPNSYDMPTGAPYAANPNLFDVGDWGMAGPNENPIADWYSSIKDFAEDFEKKWEYVEKVMGNISTIYSSIIDIMNSADQRFINGLQANFDEYETLMRGRIAFAKANGEETQKLEDELQAERELREQEIAERKVEMQRRSFESQKALSIAQILTTGPLAFVQALASAPPPFGAILAGITAASVAAQLAAALSSTFTPQLADGGLVPAAPGGRLYTLGEAGQQELVIPLDRFLRQFGRGQGNQVVIQGSVIGVDSDDLVRQIMREMNKLQSRNSS